MFIVHFQLVVLNNVSWRMYNTMNLGAVLVCGHYYELIFGFGEYFHLQYVSFSFVFYAIVHQYFFSSSFIDICLFRLFVDQSELRECCKLVAVFVLRWVISLYCLFIVDLQVHLQFIPHRFEDVFVWCESILWFSLIATLSCHLITQCTHRKNSFEMTQPLILKIIFFLQ